MLLIKSFDDYYDFGIGFGVDKKIVYNRKMLTASVGYDEVTLLGTTDKMGEKADPETAEKIRSIVEYVSKHGRRPGFHSPLLFREIAYLGFCGKIYTVPYSSANFPLREYFWTRDDVPLKALNKSLNVIESGFDKKARTVEKWLDKNELVKIHDAHDFFIEHELVCFLVMGSTVIINPVLSKLGFQKYMPGLEAFQTLSMFLAEMNTHEVDNTSGSDEDIRDSKGFDKASFKNRGEKKKRK